MLEEAWNNYQVYLNDEIDFASDDPMMIGNIIGRNDKPE